MLKRIVRAIIPAHREETAKLESKKLRKLVRGIATARPEEIGCDECFEELDCFVESTLAGKNVAEAMPWFRSIWTAAATARKNLRRSWLRCAHLFELNALHRFFVTSYHYPLLSVPVSATLHAHLRLAQLVPRHSDFEKLHSALKSTIIFIFPHRDRQA